jgi:hypothetical protein
MKGSPFVEVAKHIGASAQPHTLEINIYSTLGLTNKFIISVNNNGPNRDMRKSLTIPQTVMKFYRCMADLISY